MIIPNLDPRVFVPGKVVQVRNQANPMIIAKLALISVEEHIRHVSEMLEWLCPNSTGIQKAAVSLHDIGKKVGVRWDFLKGLRFEPKHLRADFYGVEVASNFSLSPQDAGERYVTFVQADKHRRFWPIRDDSGELRDVRMDLDPPFGNHAAEVTADDLRIYRYGSLDLNQNPESLDYIFNLVRLHHSFQPERIIAACAQHGEGFVTDLYRLIVADHMGSRWAEYVVQQTEMGLEKPDREDFFGDVTVSVAADPQVENERDGLKAVSFLLQRDRLPDEQGPPPEKKLMIQYHAVVVNWDLKELAERPQQKASRKSSERITSTRRGRSRN